MRPKPRDLVDAFEARRILERWYPEQRIRHLFLDLVRTAYQYALANNPLGVEVTLRDPKVNRSSPPFLRLNVGVRQIIIAMPDEILVEAHTDACEAFNLDRFPEVRVYEQDIVTRQPGVLLGVYPEDLTAGIAALLGRVCWSVIDEQAVGHSPFSQAHTEGFLDYLRQELQVEVASPGYW